MTLKQEKVLAILLQRPVLRHQWTRGERLSLQALEDRGLAKVVYGNRLPDLGVAKQADSLFWVSTWAMNNGGYRNN